MGRNYGWVFTAYGVAGILGPLLATTRVWGLLAGVLAILAASAFASPGVISVQEGDDDVDDD